MPASDLTPITFTVERDVDAARVTAVLDAFGYAPERVVGLREQVKDVLATCSRRRDAFKDADDLEAQHAIYAYVASRLRAALS